MDPDEYKSYKESFDAFDWNNNGKISYTSLQVKFNDNDDLLHYSVTLYVQQQKIKNQWYQEKRELVMKRFFSLLKQFVSL